MSHLIDSLKTLIKRHGERSCHSIFFFGAAVWIFRFLLVGWLLLNLLRPDTGFAWRINLPIRFEFQFPRGRNFLSFLFLL